jgi:ATP-dependent DNA helicase PIF1
LILSGDFLQLPPVAKYNECKKFCFQAKCWDEAVEMTMLLTQVQRQNDAIFIDLLEELRFGRFFETFFFFQRKMFI